MQTDKQPDTQPALVALVTGAGRNIGREIALGLAASGFAVAVNVRSSVEEGQAVVDEITASGGQALLCVADVTDQQAVKAVMAQISQAWGRLDVVINNAAIRREAKIDDISAHDWHDTLAVILDGAFFCSQAALPMLRKSPRGAIINIGGMTARTGAAQRVHVVTAKAGLEGMTRALAREPCLWPSSWWLAARRARAFSNPPTLAINSSGQQVHRSRARGLQKRARSQQKEDGPGQLGWP